METIKVKVNISFNEGLAFEVSHGEKLFFDFSGEVFTGAMCTKNKETVLSNSIQEIYVLFIKRDSLVAKLKKGSHFNVISPKVIIGKGEILEIDRSLNET